MTLPCCVLAVDPGKHSGVACFYKGKLISYELVDCATNDVEDHTGFALDVAHNARLPLVLVGETWGRGGPMGMAQWQSLGAAWKRWDWALDAMWEHQKTKHGSQRPNYRPKRVRVHTSTWRAAVYDSRPPKGESKAVAVATANRMYGLRLDDDEHDIAEAILLGRYAVGCNKVRDKLPKTLLARHGA